MSGYQKQARVHLMTLSVRTSSRTDRVYMSGWLGKASVVAFMGEPDKYGNLTWDVYATTPEPRQDTAQPRDTPRSPRPAAAAGEAPAARHGASRQPSQAARRDQRAREVAERCGLTEDPSDDLPL